jgi:hypothetical protein
MLRWWRCPTARCWSPAASPGRDRARSPCRFVPPTHPLYTRCTNIFGTFFPETTMRPNPRSGVGQDSQHCVPQLRSVEVMAADGASPPRRRASRVVKRGTSARPATTVSAAAPRVLHGGNRPRVRAGGGSAGSGWRPAAPMGVTRDGAAAGVLPSGRVVVAGGVQFRTV